MLRGGFKRTVLINGTNTETDLDFYRGYSGSLLEIRCSIKDSTGVKAVSIHTNLNGKWENLPLESVPGEKGVFVFRVEKLHAGLFMFRLYGTSGNDSLWDPAGYVRFLCDPESSGNIRMYTLIPNVSGRISDWTEMLGDISESGFNTLHILPFTTMGSSESPYSSSDLFSIDSAYADEVSEFRKFASKAKRKGIKICLDIVLNHISNENIICRTNADWIIPDPEREDGMKRAGCYHNNSWISWEDLVLVNYNHPDPDTRNSIYRYMLKYVLFWISAAGGKDTVIRLDNLHSSNRLFIEWLIPEIRKKYPQVIILSEYFSSAVQLNEDVAELGLNLLTANSWEYPFAPVLEGYLRELHFNSSAAEYLLSPVSHDTESVGELFGTSESLVPRYTCCALMGTGPAGLVQGIEFGIEKKIDFIGRVKKVDGQEIFETGKDYRNFIKKINRLHEYEECFRIKGNVEFLPTGNDSLIVCRRNRDDYEGFLIAANFNTNNSEYFQWSFSGEVEMIIVENAELTKQEDGKGYGIRLGACGICVLKIIHQ